MIIIICMEHIRFKPVYLLFSYLTSLTYRLQLYSARLLYEYFNMLPNSNINSIHQPSLYITLIYYRVFIAVLTASH